MIRRSSCIKPSRAFRDDLFRTGEREGRGLPPGVGCDRPNLPLRGKLGWMTPRTGQKKTGKTECAPGGSRPKREPLYFFPAVLRPALNGDMSAPQHIRDGSFVQSRWVVFH